MAVAVFNYDQWLVLFPEFQGSVDESLADLFFTISGSLLDNTDCSPVRDAAVRLSFMNYAVAHLASLSGYPNADGVVPAPSGMVGRVNSATEGTVSVSSDYGAVSENQAWWLQSSYGATFWQLTRGLRTARYVPARPRNFGPGFGYPGGYGGFR